MSTPIRIAQRAGLAALALGIGGALAATPAFASVPTNSPGAPTFSVQGTNLPSTTAENLNVVAGSACSFPGNTGEQYFSFLVPAGTDLTALTFHNSPLADQGVALITGPDGNGSYLSGTSAANTPPGGILPQYAFGLELGELTDPNGGGLTATGPTQVGPGTNGAGALIPTGQTSADYDAGIACVTGAGVETDVFYTTVTFTAAANDPHGFTFTTPTSGTGPLVPEAPLAVGLPLGGAAVLAGSVFINRRRRRSTAVPAA